MKVNLQTADWHACQSTQRGMKMEKEKMLQKLDLLTNEEKSLMLEKITFCKLADDFDFENYFRIGELDESGLICLISFLHHQDCYLMMLDVMNRYKQRFALQDESILGELSFSKQFISRLERMDVL